MSYDHKIFLGKSRSDWTPQLVHVYAELRGFVDTLNPGDREVQTITHETVRYGDVPHIAITWTYGTAAEIRRGDGSGGAGIDAEVLDGIVGEDARAKAQRIHQLAERWHLNTMRAGCAHQTPVYENDRYGRRVPSLDR